MSLDELPQIFQYHVFCCSQSRPPDHPRGSCGARGAGELWQKVSSLVQSRQLTHVAVVPTGCLGFCTAGPLMVIYPEGIWYMPRSGEDIEKIVESHFEQHNPVEDLIVVLSR